MRQSNLLSREGNRGLDPRGSPSPSPKFGDGAGTGIDLIKVSGTGTASILGIFGEKSPKNHEFWGGDGGNILGDLVDTSGMGAVQTFENFEGIFGEFIFSCKITLFLLGI